MKITEKQQNILLNLLLEKMQEVAQTKNTDVLNALKDYKKDLHELYGNIIDLGGEL